MYYKHNSSSIVLLIMLLVTSCYKRCVISYLHTCGRSFRYPISEIRLSLIWEPMICEGYRIKIFTNIRYQNLWTSHQYRKSESFNVHVCFRVHVHVYCPWSCPFLRQCNLNMTMDTDTDVNADKVIIKWFILDIGFLRFWVSPISEKPTPISKRKP